MSGGGCHRCTAKVKEFFAHGKTDAYTDYSGRKFLPAQDLFLGLRVSFTGVIWTCDSHRYWSTECGRVTGRVAPAGRMRRERPGHSLQAAALVNGGGPRLGGLHQARRLRISRPAKPILQASFSWGERKHLHRTP